MTPWEYDQQNPDCGKLYRTTSSVSPSNTSQGERESEGGKESLRMKRDLRDTSAFRKVRDLTGIPDFNKITLKLYNLTLYND